jgi:hypothetical protein
MKVAPVTIGRRFGRWLVLSEAPNKGRRRSYFCRCDCGTEKDVSSDYLRHNRSQSCGCARNEKNKFPPGVAPMNALFLVYKLSARKKDIVWQLTREEFETIVLQNCRYCGSVPSQLSRTRHGETIKYNGIDRLNNNLGYLRDNAVPCCKHCNYAKRKMTETEFLAWVKQVYAHNYLFPKINPPSCICQLDKFIEMR